MTVATYIVTKRDGTTTEVEATIAEIHAWFGYTVTYERKA